MQQLPLLLDHYDLLLQQAFLLLAGGVRENGSAGRRRRAAHAREVLAAEGDEGGLVGELAQDAVILGGGGVGVALFAVAFAEAEDGGGGELAVFVELVGDGLVSLDGGAEVLVGLFFEEAALEGGGEVVGGGTGGRGEDAEGSDEKGGREGEASVWLERRTRVPRGRMDWLFPLTPALSLGERENCRQLSGEPRFRGSRHDLATAQRDHELIKIKSRIRTDGLFPLTPALSLGERENARQVSGKPRFMEKTPRPFDALCGPEPPNKDEPLSPTLSPSEGERGNHRALSGKPRFRGGENAWLVAS